MVNSVLDKGDYSSLSDTPLIVPPLNFIFGVLLKNFSKQLQRLFGDM